MSTYHLPTSGKLFQQLIDHWRKNFPKRASGGSWALSGFALQTSAYLLRFFRQLGSGADPGLLAEMEHLSDILYPMDGKLILIQVKRTLTKHALISAVEEAYLITDLCRRETPGLIDHLRFQIACQKRVVPTGVNDLSASDVIKSGANAVSWNLMLDLFDKALPITEEPDGLDQLHTFLWSIGIKNTHAFIERCAGCLLMSFGTNDPSALRHVGRELADYFFTAERHTSWEPVGRLLTTDDITPDSRATEYVGVLTGQQPRLEHLTKGFFRDRPQIFQNLWHRFTRWVSSLEGLDREISPKIPVFWIAGRSGEGKSVLLLQLVAETLRLNLTSPLLQLKEGDDLPRLVTNAPDGEQLRQRSFGRIFAVVDDVYDLHTYERDEWDATLLSECDYRSPPIAIITCGPTEQQEQFASRLRGQFEVTTFQVPPLGLEECHAFLKWYESRTGEVREWDELTIENPLLVQLMFELAHGEQMPEFARRFRKRLSDIRVFDAARAILALNALYMDAPLSLLTDNNTRDGLEYLCKAEQFHFRITPAADGHELAGIHLAHPHLSWLLFIEWIEKSPTTLAKAWARQLAISLRVVDEGHDSLSASKLFYRILHTPRLCDDDSQVLWPAANRRELVRELYRLHVELNNSYPSPSTLARWLELEHKLQPLCLVPDPAQSAITILSDDTLAPSVQGTAIIWLWLIAENRSPQQARDMRVACLEFCVRRSNNSGAGSAVAWLLDKQNDLTMHRFALNWLKTNLQNAQSFQVLMRLVAVSPNDDSVIKLTFEWLACNETHPGASLPLAVLVNNSLNAEVRNRATKWLSVNEANPYAHHLVGSMIAMYPDDMVLRAHALNWVVCNTRHSSSYRPLAALVAARIGDAEVRLTALDWLASNELHPQVYQVIAALVAASPADEFVIKYALEWLFSNEDHQFAYQVLISLVAANPDNIAARKLVLSWRSHPQAHQLIRTLVTANPNDAEVKERAFDWLATNETHSHAYQVISALVAANPTDVAVVERADAWLNANNNHPKFNLLLNVMIARSNGAKQWLERGEFYVKKPGSLRPDLTIGVLLTAGKADPKFIEMAFDFMEGTADKVVRTNILYHLSRALIRSFHNGVRYLNEKHHEDRKKIVCASIAVGMKRFPDTIARFALEVVDQLEVDHTSNILRNVISHRLENDFLDEMVAQWLTTNHRRRGYGGMLDALHTNLTFWERLLSLDILPKSIIGDFQTRVTNVRR